jgi:NSS family neurotransmitter:Na+ symporter
METVASSIMDRFHFSRPKATAITFVFSLIVGVIVCLGYNVFYLEMSLPNGAKGQQILDLLDYIANSILLPVVALVTCILVGWCYKPKGIIEEVQIGLDGKKFYREKLFVAVIKYVAPILLIIIMLQAFNVFSFLG